MATEILIVGSARPTSSIFKPKSTKGVALGTQPHNSEVDKQSLKTHRRRFVVVFTGKFRESKNKFTNM